MYTCMYCPRRDDQPQDGRQPLPRRQGARERDQAGSYIHIDFIDFIDIYIYLCSIHEQIYTHTHMHIHILIYI